MTANMSKKVLVVEDDKFYASVYKRYLKIENVDVEVVENGVKALESLKAAKPDLIVLDLIMPEMDGFALLKKIKEDNNFKDIKVIIMSNLGQEEDIKKAEALGAQDYIVKSNISFDDIYDVVVKHLQ